MPSNTFIIAAWWQHYTLILSQEEFGYSRWDNQRQLVVSFTSNQRIFQKYFSLRANNKDYGMDK